MKLLLILFLPFITLPAQAITWKEFWEPFTYERPYYRTWGYVPMCRKRIFHEEYVPPNPWRSGYVNRWTETVRVPCDNY